MGHRVASHVRANVVAYVALFFALGGTSFAAAKTLVPRNSVGSPQVIDNSLRLRDFNRTQRARLRGARGRQGRQGIQGAQGAKGDKGDPGATNVVLVTKVVHVVASGGNSVDCPARRTGNWRRGRDSRAGCRRHPPTVRPDRGWRSTDQVGRRRLCRDSRRKECRIRRDLRLSVI
jgi:hypothetical protein